MAKTSRQSEEINPQTSPPDILVSTADLTSILDQFEEERRRALELALKDEIKNKSLLKKIYLEQTTREYLNENRDQLKNINSKIFEKIGEINKREHTALQANGNYKPISFNKNNPAPLEIKGQGGNTLHKLEYKTDVDLVVANVPKNIPKGPMHLSLALQDERGENIDADKAAFFNISYGADGKIKSMNYPEPLEFEGDRCKFTIDGQPYYLKVSKAALDGLNAELAQTRSKAQNLARDVAAEPALDSNPETAHKPAQPAQASSPEPRSIRMAQADKIQPSIIGVNEPELSPQQAILTRSTPPPAHVQQTAFTTTIQPIMYEVSKDSAKASKAASRVEFDEPLDTTELAQGAKGLVNALKAIMPTPPPPSSNNTQEKSELEIAQEKMRTRIDANNKKGVYDNLKARGSINQDSAIDPEMPSLQAPAINLVKAVTGVMKKTDNEKLAGNSKKDKDGKWIVSSPPKVAIGSQTKNQHNAAAASGDPNHNQFSVPAGGFTHKKTKINMSAKPALKHAVVAPTAGLKGSHGKQHDQNNHNQFSAPQFAKSVKPIDPAPLIAPSPTPTQGKAKGITKSEGRRE